MFGTDMLSKDHKEIVPFRNGDFVTRNYKYVNGKAYSNRDNQPLETPPADLDKDKKQVQHDLEMSDKVLNGDLFRFYKNPDFNKLNPADYKYPTGPKANQK